MAVREHEQRDRGAVPHLLPPFTGCRLLVVLQRRAAMLLPARAITMHRHNLRLLAVKGFQRVEMSLQ